MKLPRLQPLALQATALLHSAEQLPRRVQSRVVLRVLLRLLLPAPRRVRRIGQQLSQAVPTVACRVMLHVVGWPLVPGLLALLLLAVLRCVGRAAQLCPLGHPLLWRLVWWLLPWLLRAGPVGSLPWAMLWPPLRPRQTVRLRLYGSLPSIVLRLSANRLALFLARLHPVPPTRRISYPPTAAVQRLPQHVPL